ncbi:MAG: hypothetical protein JSR39_07140 [Verrucomicrobia bacterium]|nr:hypothetical protein [Verrucomicrobiota bacterium]
MLKKWSKEPQAAVHWQIWDLAGRPEMNDSNWGKHHVLRFTDALEKAIQNLS